MNSIRKTFLALLISTLVIAAWTFPSDPVASANSTATAAGTTTTEKTDAGLKKRIVNVDVIGHCSLGAAPVGPNGAWTVVEKDVEKVCAPGTSCRTGACNCDDLQDGTVMGHTIDADEKRVCRRIAGQKCTADNECFEGVPCKEGVCTCDKTKKDFSCVDKKNDVYILA